MSEHGHGSVSRRSLIAGASLVGVFPAVLSTTPAKVLALQDDEDEPETGRTLEATMPSWTLVVHTVQNPYAGTLVSPAEPNPDMRYIGIDVEVRNDSDRPLSVSVSNFRLLSADGTDYPAGGAAGSDPRLFDVNMMPTERVRGWIYCVVPNETVLSNLVYIPPAPQILVPLPESS